MNIQKNAQVLRKNMTKEERHLWYDCLKHLDETVKRQFVIGPYIVDFYCASAALVIELDGSQHYENEGKQNDLIRDAYLSNLGLLVKRYSNHEIHTQFKSVCEDIYETVTKRKNMPIKGKVSRQKQNEK
ncbi:MAG: endonuclease domain-containing protein [Oscillospiraceae bacterium]|nr:endonuclease domain-containing protein [Oscillospiraceae bacterium]